VDEQPVAPKALSKQEVTRILRKGQQLGTPRDIAILELLAATGLRASEVAALKVGDKEIRERSGWVTVRAPRAKGRKRRRVPLHAKARRVLKKYLRTGSEAVPGDPLFITLRGTDEVKQKRIKPFTVWYTVRKYAEEADVKNISPHAFRHIVATRLVRNPDVDLVTVATYLGHSRLETTARYSLPPEDDPSAAADQLAE
jgi:integrase/recombinase XerC